MSPASQLQVPLSHRIVSRPSSHALRVLLDKRQLRAPSRYSRVCSTPSSAFPMLPPRAPCSARSNEAGTSEADVTDETQPTSVGPTFYPSSSFPSKMFCSSSTASKTLFRQTITTASSLRRNHFQPQTFNTRQFHASAANMVIKAYVSARP